MGDLFGYINSKVVINGQDVASGPDGKLDELRISLLDHGVSRFEAIFLVANPDWKLLKIAGGSRIQIHLGFKGEPDKLFEGEVTSVRYRGRRNDGPMLILEGCDMLHRLDRGTHQRLMLKVTDGDIVKKCIQEAGLASGKIDDPGIQYESVAQYNQTNLEFLMDRARRLGQCLWAEGDKIHFRARGAVTDSVELDLLSNIEKVNIRSTVAWIAPTVQIRGWDPKTKKEQIGQAKGGSESLVESGGQAGTAVAKEFAPSTVTVGDSLPRSQKEADLLAKQHLARRAMRFTSGSVTLPGKPEIKPGARVKLKGLPPKECGSYHVGQVIHRWGTREGYFTELRVYRNAQAKG